MPHMARLPIHAYNDGEVSFHSPILLNTASKQLSFSSDEEDEEEDAFRKWKNKSRYGELQKENICMRFINMVVNIVRFLFWLLLFPIIYPIKLVYQGSKSCFYATKRLDLLSIPRCLLSIIISLALSSANCITSLGRSLIHICRCRSYSLCRSRWSPYH